MCVICMLIWSPKGWSHPKSHCPKGGGSGSFVVVDPDGNPVLIDQHR
jgi:hypothetical protein